jgi:predicted AAA+ superfamily ATPase
MSQDFKRLLKLPKKHSLFLFGPRGVGKSTLLKQCFAKNSYFIDLLDTDTEEKFSRNPEELRYLVEALDKKTSHIIIDEVQKIPRLLDLVHLLIEKYDKKFILTGSSARKLKYGNANLLAGRAFVYNLYPFSFLELGESFDLKAALHYGLLPKLVKFKKKEDKILFLKSYAQTYLKEEIQMEQLVRKLEPFRNFLEVSSQMNGKIINYSNIARDVGVEDKTIREYYSILEDTLIGFSLTAFQHSFRKQLSTKPKFYFFDLGVVRALNRTLNLPLEESTFEYGNAFEHFIITEVYKLVGYFHDEYRLHYLKTKDDVEVDLVIDRPGQPLLFIEIKSSKNVRAEDLSKFIKITKEFGDCEAICLSRDECKKKIHNVMVYPWQEGLKALV